MVCEGLCLLGSCLCSVSQAASVGCRFTVIDFKQAMVAAVVAYILFSEDHILLNRQLSSPYVVFAAKSGERLPLRLQRSGIKPLTSRLTQGAQQPLKLHIRLDTAINLLLCMEACQLGRRSYNLYLRALRLTYKL